MSFLAVVLAAAAMSGPSVSQGQLDHAIINTHQATLDKCVQEQTYTLVGYNPVTGTWNKHLVGHCESVHVGTAFQDLKARQQGKRRILVLGSFIIHDRWGPTDGRKVKHLKLFRYWVPAPQFEWLFAHEQPVTPWVTKVLAG